MPIHQVETPDGQIIKVEAPEGATDDQILAFAQSNWSPKQKPERSWGEALVTDPLASIASGVGSLAQLPGQLGQLAGFVQKEDTSTGLMGAGKDLQAWAEKQKSEGLKQKQAAFQADIAKQEGFFNEASTAIKGTLSDPALLSSFLFEQVPNLVGSLGGGMVAKGAVKLALRDATETALQKAAVRGAVSTSAVQQGADVGSNTYEQTYEGLIAKGVDPKTANEQALTAARESALGATVASLGAQFLVPGGQTLEKAFLGRGLPGAGGFVKGLVGEGGSEAFEEGAGQFISNLAQSQYLPETDLMKGVGSSAGLGGVLGGIMGGAGGVSLAGATPIADTTAPPTEPAGPTLALEDKGFKPVVFPDGTIGYTPEQVAQYEEQQFQQKFDPEVQFAKQLEAEGAKPLPQLPHYNGPTMYVMPDGSTITSPEELKAYQEQQFQQKFDPQVQFAKQLEAEGAKPLPQLPHYNGPTMYVMPDGSTITSPEELKAYQEQQFQQKFDPEVQFSKQLEAAGAKPLPALPNYSGPTMYVMPDGSTITSPEELKAYEQAQFEQRISPEVQFAKQLEEQRAAEEVRQKELAELQVQRQALADEIKAADAEQTALNEATYGKTLTAKEQKILDNQNRQFEQRRIAAEKAAAKVAEQERRAFLKAKQQELNLPQEIAPEAVEGQPDLFAQPAKLDETVKQADQANPQAKMQLREAGAEFAPEVQQSAEAIRAELTPFLDKIGLGNVGLQLVNSINNGTADGAYFRNVIQIALDAKNPLATLRHETIHALKELGVFTKQEWNYLSKMAKEQWIDQFISKDKQAQYREQYRKDNGSEEGFDAYLQEEAIADAFRSFGDKPKAGILKRIVNKLKAFFDATGNWFRGNGFNSIDSIFSGVEAGRYAPSAEAVAEAKPETAPKYQLTNAPPGRTTKTQKTKDIFESVGETTAAVMDKANRQELGVKARVKFIDTSAGLTNVLAKAGLSRFQDGVLRADLLNHAKAQTINLVRNLVVTGLPKLNSDGTIGIERSEKTLANAQQKADDLETNPYVKASGLTGREFVAEVAVALRGREIQKDDARRNAKGREQLALAKEKAAQAKKLAGGNPKEYHALMQEAANLEKKGLKEEAKTVRKKARETSRGNLTVYRALMKEIRELRREGYLNKNLKRELRTTPEKLAWADKQVENVPELNEIFDIWRTNNHAAIDLQRAVGILTQEQADEYKSHENYLPLFKSAEDMSEERLFGRGAGTKSTVKQHKLVGGTHEINVFENVHKQMARMVASAYENQTRSVAANQLMGVGAAEETNKSNPDVNLRFRRDGKEVSMIIEDETVLAAFQAFAPVVNPIVKFMGGISTVMRKGALITPQFWLKQLIRDPMHSSMVTNTMTTPFHSMKNFADIILKRESEAYRTLVEHGVIGEVGNTLTLQEYIDSAGAAAGKKESIGKHWWHKLEKVHESSDAATRIGIYNDALKKAKAQGMNDTDAKNFAVMQAREAINFAVQGSSPALSYMRQLIPFLSATISSMDTVWRAATGTGLNKEEAAQIRRIFWTKAAIFTTFVAAYAMMYQDDPDYLDQPDFIKDNNFLIPMPSMTRPGEKEFIRIPIPFELGFLFKILPEASIRYAYGTSTGKDVAHSIKEGALKTIPGEGNLLPQALKPLYENWTNHSFFTGKPIVSMGEMRLPPSLRGASSSEFAKQLGGVIDVSPQMIDNLVAGYFAEWGNMVSGITGYTINKAMGIETPEMNPETYWGIRSFVTNPNASAAISTFYDINTQAQETVNEFNEYKKTGDYKAIEKFVEDPEKIQQMAAQKALSQIGDTMSKIRAQLRFVQANQDMSPQERRQMINDLQKQQAEIAAIGVNIAKQLGVR